MKSSVVSVKFHPSGKAVIAGSTSFKLFIVSCVMKVSIEDQRIMEEC